MARPRLVAVDVLRGITVAGMLVVNDQGDQTHVFPTLAHSAWHGCTLADVVFPAFLLVLGITTQLSSSRGAHDALDAKPLHDVWRRAAWLVGIGLLLNAYPFYEKSLVAGPEWLPSFARHIAARLESLRLLGVLQRLGIVYLVTAMMARWLDTRALAAALVLLLVGYWVLLTQAPPPFVPATGSEAATAFAPLNDPVNTWPVYIDQLLLDWRAYGYGWHLWDRAIPYEPEGVLATLSAVSTALIGVLVGRWITTARALTERVRALVLCGAALVGVGLAWSVTYPLNKPLWTGSYVLFTAGVVMAVLSLLLWHTDLRDGKRWLTPWLVFGTNPIVVYVGSELLANILRSSIKWRVDGRLVGTGAAVTQGLGRMGVPLEVGSLVWGVLFTAMCGALVLPLYRRKRFIRL